MTVWIHTPIRALASCNVDVLPETYPADREIHYLEISDVQEGRIRWSEPLKFGDAPSRARRRVHDGDVLVSTVRTYLRAVAGVSNSPAEAVASTGFAVLRPESVDSGFLSYALLNITVLDEIVAKSVGVSYPAINASELTSIKIPTPDRERQRAISSFLDRETAEIDAFIADQEELIGLLTERRAATITHAVTKGIVAATPMKYSGVEWLGEIPAHWIAGNIRRFADMRTGHTPSRSRDEYWVDCHIPWFTLADVWQLRAGATYLGDTASQISELGLENSAAELLPSGTVVLSRTASVGFPGIMPRPMATSQDYWNWICKSDLIPKFLWYQFLAMRPHFGSLVHGSTHKTIYQADAAALKISVPPVEEQSSIVAQLDRELEELDAAIGDAREAVALSRERRAALISAAVTGKIDVRGAAS